MKKLFKLLASVLVISTSSLTLVSCFPKEVEVYANDSNYEVIKKDEMEKQIPWITKRIASFKNSFMRENITKNLYFNIKTAEESTVIEGGLLNERQTEIMVDTLSSNLRVYKIIDTDLKLNPELFEATWATVTNTSKSKKFTVDITYESEKFVTMGGEFFVADTEEISEINENTFVQISDMAAENQKIVTSPGIGGFWGAEIIGDKYTEEEHVALWETGGKYEYYEWQPKQTMTWKGPQKLSIDALKQTMTDYLSSRLITSGTIQSNIIINYEDVEVSTSGLSGGSEQFIPKEDAPKEYEKFFQRVNMSNSDDYYFYFEEENDFGAKTMIDPMWPKIWYKSKPDHKITQGGSMFQSHLDYKW